jgi:hypothetical protein
MGIKEDIYWTGGPDSGLRLLGVAFRAEWGITYYSHLVGEQEACSW